MNVFRFAFMMILAIAIVSGCTNASEPGGETADQGVQVDDRVVVVTTFYPLYDFAKKIGGDYVQVRNLVPAGADPHQWTPSTSDMVTMSEADLFIYNGAGFEIWTDHFLTTLDERTIVLEATKNIPLLEVDPYDYEHHQEHEVHDHDHDHHHGQFDPHVWVSPNRAIVMAENITDSLVEAAPQFKEQFMANFAELKLRLEELDQQFSEVVANGNKEYIVVSHNAFAYLAHDYGIGQRFIMGLSPEAEPTIQHLSDISHFIKEHDIQYILFEVLASPKVAETLANDLGIETLVFNPIEGLTQEEEKAGEDYLSIMKQNIETIEKALQ